MATKASIASLKESVVAECRKFESHALDQISSSVKAAVEKEARKAVEDGLKSTAWKKEVGGLPPSAIIDEKMCLNGLLVC